MTRIASSPPRSVLTVVLTPAPDGRVRGWTHLLRHGSGAADDRRQDHHPHPLRGQPHHPLRRAGKAVRDAPPRYRHQRRGARQHPGAPPRERHPRRSRRPHQRRLPSHPHAALRQRGPGDKTRTAPGASISPPTRWRSPTPTTASTRRRSPPTTGTTWSPPRRAPRHGGPPLRLQRLPGAHDVRPGRPAVREAGPLLRHLRRPVHHSHHRRGRRVGHGHGRPRPRDRSRRIRRPTS